MTTQGWKEKHKAPSPEDVDTKQLYSFNFNPIKQPKVGQLGSYLNKIWDEIDGCINCTVQMVPELSRLGRLHFHGIVSIDKIMQFYLSDIHKLMKEGTVYIDTIDDLGLWNEYMFKQRTLMQDFIESNHSREIKYLVTSRSRDKLAYREFSINPARDGESSF